MNKILFLDRDGTLIEEPEDEQIDTIDKLRFLPGAIGALRRIAADTDFALVMVTNQDGLGTEAFPEAAFWPLHHLMLRTLEGEGVRFEAVHIDRSFPQDGSPNRKPGTGMLTAYLDGSYDLAHSFVIGDRAGDVALAHRLGCQAILVGPPEREAPEPIALRSTDWHAIADYLMGQRYTATVHRRTRETDIRLRLGLHGTGQAAIATGIGFFDHMLEQLARHGGMDLTLTVDGDLHVDAHHSIEDTGLVLGQALREALGEPTGLARYGFWAPMDESLAHAFIDLSGRPHFEWRADFRRESIGAMPTEMFPHFFKSFADQARCTLHLQAEGMNEHHKIEALFKAWARALRMAVARPFGEAMPSTKGSL